MLRLVRGSLLGAGVGSSGSTALAGVLQETRAAVHHHKEFKFNIMRYWGQHGRKRRPNRHRNELFRAARARKFIEVDLPDFEQHKRAMKGEVTETEKKEEVLKRMEEDPNFAFPRQWNRERPIHSGDSGRIFDSYIPPAEDESASYVQRARRSVEHQIDTFKKSREGQSENMLSREKPHRDALLQHEPEWDPETFAGEAQELYKSACERLAAADKDALYGLVTDFCLNQLLSELELRSLRWRWVETLEPPRVVQIRSASIDGSRNKDNVHVQLTVRLHSRQCLAIYDQWGRLHLGSPDKPEVVLEYLVFERHVSNPYSNWRIHAKIRPDWDQNRRQPIRPTFRRPQLKDPNQTIPAHQQEQSRTAKLITTH